MVWYIWVGEARHVGWGGTDVKTRRILLTVAGPLMSARFAGWYSFGKIDSLFFTLMYYSQCFIIVDSDLIIMLLFPVRIWYGKKTTAVAEISGKMHQVFLAYY